MHIGLPKDDEELDENGYVLHNDQNGIRVSWSARDPESDVEQYSVAIGTTQSSESILQYTVYGTETTAYINNIFFEPSRQADSDGNTTLYIVSVKAINGAGLESIVGQSKYIFVQKANVPGIVFDGRDLYEDASFTIDHTSIAASFYGFESEACDIISYDWAIGTTEYGTDVLTYTDYGVVMNNHTHGQAQIHTELFEDVTYFVSVRAVTGCEGEFIVSCSDGLTLDRKAPEVVFDITADNDTFMVIQDNVIYQAGIDSLNIVGNVSDHNGIERTEWSLGTLPALDDKHPFTSDLSSITAVVTLVPGEAVFLTARTTDKAGNTNVTSSLAVITDSTAPTIKGLECSKYVSVRKPTLTCRWETVEEDESRLGDMTISIWVETNNSDILHNHNIRASDYAYSKDLYDTLKQDLNITQVSVEIIVTNVVGLSKSYGRDIIVDRTPPISAGLDVVTSTYPGEFADRHQKCQLPRGYVEVRLKETNDPETGLDFDR